MVAALTPAVLTLLGLTVVFTSFLSGVFGMAGGMIMLGVLLIYFDVATTMVLFSIIQLASNGWRSLHWRAFVRWPIFFHYVAGALVAFAAMRLIAFVPDKATVYVLLGLVPFAVELVPRRARPNIERRGTPFITGLLTTVLQFIAGVGGLFLDVFFQKSSFDRKTTVATKAVTQAFSHMLRAVYYGSLAGVGEVKPELWVSGIVLAFVGAALAPFVVERMTDHGFRRWTRWIIFTVAAVYLARGIVLILEGRLHG